MPQLDWNAIINTLREEVSPAQFQNWFKPVCLVASDERKVVLSVPSRFHQEWLRSNYEEKISQAIHQQCGVPLQLEFEVLVGEVNEEASRSQLELLATTPPPSRPPLRIVTPNNPAPEPSFHRPNLPPFPNPFLELEYNHVVFQCSRIFSEGRENQINPLILVGGVGMGKTHLLSLIGKWIHASNPKLRVRYTTAEAFIAELGAGYRSDNIHDFKRKYREETDVLLFDDIQGLTRKNGTQQELLHVFNEILSRGGRIAFTSNIPIYRLEDFIEPLKSRLASGVAAEIKYPSFEERVEILTEKCRQDQMSVDNTVLRALASKSQSDIRELVGTLFRIHLQAKLENRTLDTEYLTSEGWSSIQEVKKEAITVEEIIRLVEHNYRVVRTDMVSKSRKSLIVWSRQVAMYLARHYTDLPLEEIGKIFGRDHATVLHAYQKVTETMEQHPTRRYEIEHLKQKLSARSPQPTQGPNLPLHQD